MPPHVPNGNRTAGPRIRSVAGSTCARAGKPRGVVASLPPAAPPPLPPQPPRLPPAPRPPRLPHAARPSRRAVASPRRSAADGPSMKSSKPSSRCTQSRHRSQLASARHTGSARAQAWPEPGRPWRPTCHHFHRTWRSSSDGWTPSRLGRYQRQSLAFMLQLEASNDAVHSAVPSKAEDRRRHYSVSRPPVKGGWLCDEMGSMRMRRRARTPPQGDLPMTPLSLAHASSVLVPTRVQWARPRCAPRSSSRAKAYRPAR